MAPEIIVCMIIFEVILSTGHDAFTKIPTLYLSIPETPIFYKHYANQWTLHQWPSKDKDFIGSKHSNKRFLVLKYHGFGR